MEWDRPDTPNLRLLAGLGVPDVRANNGDWFVYTSRTDEFLRAPEGRPTSTGGRVFHVDVRDGRIESFVYGPKDWYLIDRAKRELAEIDAALKQPGLADAKFDRLTERRAEIATRELPRLECRGRSLGQRSGPLFGQRSRPRVAPARDRAARRQGARHDRRTIAGGRGRHLVGVVPSHVCAQPARQGQGDHALQGRQRR
jgi:hypothetical protein